MCHVEDGQSLHILMCGHIDMYSYLHTYHIYINIYISIFFDVWYGGWAVAIYTHLWKYRYVLIFIFISYIYIYICIFMYVYLLLTCGVEDGQSLYILICGNIDMY